MRFTLHLKSDIEALDPRVHEYAQGSAMTRMAKKASESAQEAINRAIDRPTPITRTAMKFKSASKNNLVMDVYVRDEASKGVAPVKYLSALAFGGYRRNKASENLLRFKGILPPGWQIQPGDDAPLDNYGNIRGGGAFMVQVLSALKAFQERGHMMNRTPRSMSKRKGVLKEYFVLYDLKLKTPLGVYTRVGKSREDVRQVLKFTPKRAKYSQVFDLEKLVRTAVDVHWGNLIAEAYRQMIEKAKSWGTR